MTDKHIVRSTRPTNRRLPATAGLSAIDMSAQCVHVGRAIPTVLIERRDRAPDYIPAPSTPARPESVWFDTCPSMVNGVRVPHVPGYSGAPRG